MQAEVAEGRPVLGDQFSQLEEDLAQRFVERRAGGRFPTGRIPTLEVLVHFVAHGVQALREKEQFWVPSGFAVEDGLHEATEVLRLSLERLPLRPAVSSSWPSLPLTVNSSRPRLAPALCCR